MNRGTYAYIISDEITASFFSTISTFGMEAIGFFEVLEPIYQATRHHIKMILNIINPTPALQILFLSHAVRYLYVLFLHYVWAEVAGAPPPLS